MSPRRSTIRNMRRSISARGSPAIRWFSRRLFDDGGMLRGIRMVSDPRATPIERRMAHLLGVAVINHYGPNDWNCTDLPPAEGETPVGGVFIKQHCEKVDCRNGR